MRGARALLLSAFLRAIATGTSGVLLAIYLGSVGIEPAAAARIVSSGLAGAAVSAAVALLWADRLGRRRLLMAFAAASAVGGVLFASLSRDLALGMAAFFGAVNGLGRDRSAALLIEQAMLSSLTAPEKRTSLLANYNVVQDVGLAIGSLVAGLTGVLQHRMQVDESTSLRLVLGGCSLLFLVAIPLYARLPATLEREEPRAPLGRLSRETQPVLARMVGLVLVDATASGILTSALLAFFLYKRFGLTAQDLGVLFMSARLLNAGSHVASAWLARRIGLIRTMTFTHGASSVFLALVPLAGSFPLAAALFLCREALYEIDVPARQSYVLAIVRPEERVQAISLTGMVRLGAFALGPLVAAVLFLDPVADPRVLWLGAALKVLYDAALFLTFRRVRPPEERTGL